MTQIQKIFWPEKCKLNRIRAKTKSKKNRAKSWMCEKKRRWKISSSSRSSNNKKPLTHKNVLGSEQRRQFTSADRYTYVRACMCSVYTVQVTCIITFTFTQIEPKRETLLFYVFFPFEIAMVCWSFDIRCCNTFCAYVRRMYVVCVFLNLHLTVRRLM